MAVGAQRERWDRAASQMALLANVNRSRGASALSALDFHPMRNREIPTITASEAAKLLRGS